MSLEAGREGGEGRGGGGEGEGRGGQGRGGEGGRDGGRREGEKGESEGRGGRQGRDDCYTYYSDGTIYSVYRPTVKNYIYITMTSRIT